MCPLKDGFPVKILARTKTGVAFRCPQHGASGLRYDSMDHSEALLLRVPYKTWKDAQRGEELR